MAEPTENVQSEPIEEEVTDRDLNSDPAGPPDDVKTEMSPQPTSGGVNAILVAVLLAALVGFAVYFWMNLNTQSKEQAQIDALTTKIADLTTSLEQQPEPQEAPQTADLQELFSEQLGGLGATITALNDQLASVDQRMEALETTQSAAKGGDVGVALDGLRDDLSSWKEAAESLRSENANLRATIDEQSEALAEVRLALTETQDALKAALDLKQVQDSERRAGLIGQIEAAISSGRPFITEMQALETLNDMEFGAEAKRLSETGAPTTSYLQSRFPDTARLALSADLAVQDGDGMVERSINFLKSQLGLRSVKAREGNSVDAILSRMQVAVDQADFAESLRESASLGQDVKADMESWLTAANAHVFAMQFLSELKGQTR